MSATRFRPQVLLLALLDGPLPCQDPAAVGDVVPDFEFQGLWGHDGRTRLSELRGRPVLIAGWRTHLVDGIHAARVAVEVRQKHGDDVVLILLDRNQWRDTPKSPGWVGSASFWQIVAGFIPWLATAPKAGHNAKLPIVRSGAADDRSLVLIGVDGTLLAEGSAENTREKERSSDFRVKIKKLVAAEVRRAKRGWGQDKLAVRARALAFGKGRLQAGLAMLSSARDGRNAERDAVGKEIEGHFRARLKSAGFLLSVGRFVEAKRALADLSGAVKGLEWAQEVEVLAKELRTREGERELALDKRFRKIVAPAESRKGRGNVSLLGKVKLLAESEGATRVGQRAARQFPFYKSLVSSQLGMRFSELEARLAKWLAKKR